MKTTLVYRFLCSFISLPTPGDLSIRPKTFSPSCHIIHPTYHSGVARGGGGGVGGGGSCPGRRVCGGAKISPTYNIFYKTILHYRLAPIMCAHQYWRSYDGTPHDVFNNLTLSNTCSAVGGCNS